MDFCWTECTNDNTKNTIYLKQISGRWIFVGQSVPPQNFDANILSTSIKDSQFLFFLGHGSLLYVSSQMDTPERT